MSYRRLDRVTDRSDHIFPTKGLYQTVKLRRLRGGWIGGLLVAILAGLTPSLSQELSDLDGSNGFVINGIPGHVFDNFGIAVSSAGDINNDGISDVIIGDNAADPTGYNNIGAAYVVFGSRTGFNASLNIPSLNGSNGFVINGLTSYESLGLSVSKAGDVNGDGIDDIIIGAYIALYEAPIGLGAGRAYVVFGSATGFGASVDVTRLNGSNGFVINGVRGDLAGHAVSGGGDINGDGIDDIIIGAPTGFLSGGSKEGKAYVVFGSRAGFSATLELSSLNGSNGFVINGIALGDHTGFAASIAGDINGDGIDDIVIGAPTADPGGRSYAGKAYVVFGSRTSFSSTLRLSDLNGSNGFVINGINSGDYLTGNNELNGPAGGAASGAGDVNGDGVDDLVLGAMYASPGGRSHAGQSYIVFGSRAGFSATLELSSLNGSNGFVINGINANDASGLSVSGAGDVNGDRIADIVIGAPMTPSNGLYYGGQSYVVFGSRAGFSATLELSSLNGSNGFVLNGNGLFGRAVSAAGDINNDGTDDIIIGAIGDRSPENYSGKAYVIFGKTSASPDIEISPAVYDFGNVQWGKASTAIFTISNVGGGQLTLSAISLSDSSGAFSITLPKSLPPLAAKQSITVEAAFNPKAIQTYTGAFLTITSNDSDESSINIPLSGTGVLADTPSEQVTTIVDYIQKAIANGELTGVEEGSSAAHKVQALINMIQSVGDLLAGGQTVLGCQQLADLYLKVDGVNPPPDFVTGPATAGVASAFQGMMRYYGCQ